MCFIINLPIIVILISFIADEFIKLMNRTIRGRIQGLGSKWLIRWSTTQSSNEFDHSFVCVFSFFPLLFRSGFLIFFFFSFVLVYWLSRKYILSIRSSARFWIFWLIRFDLIHYIRSNRRGKHYWATLSMQSAVYKCPHLITWIFKSYILSLLRR